MPSSLANSWWVLTLSGVMVDALFQWRGIGLGIGCENSPTVASMLKHGEKRQMSFKQTQKHFIFMRENVKTLNGARNIIEVLRGISLGEKEKAPF